MLNIIGETTAPSYSIVIGFTEKYKQDELSYNNFNTFIYRNSNLMNIQIQYKNIEFVVIVKPHHN